MKQIPFTISARTVKLLGRENVSNAEGAVIELVKNSYDAGAQIGAVLFDKRDPDFRKHAIYIIDNGSGMSEEIIEKQWMTIGTDNKEVNFIGVDGRVQSGAKGIGRLSLDRLGNKTELYTSYNENEGLIKWDVTWGDFETEGVSLNNVFAQLEKQRGTLSDVLKENIFNHKEFESALYKYNFTTGTIIKISELRDIWDYHDTVKLFKDLSMIVPPVENSQYQIVLKSTIAPGEFGIAEVLIQDEYDYKVKAKLDENKILTIEVWRNEFDFNTIDLDLFNLPEMGNYPYDIETFEHGYFKSNYLLKELIPGLENKTDEEIYEEIGPFEFVFYFMKSSMSKEDKKKFYYKNFNVHERNKWLKEMTGIKLYRDNFRVRPYGENGGSSYDWLLLGERANRSTAGPTHRSGQWRVKPYQLSGNISISRLTNINFEDKSSREGLQENNSFFIFTQLITKIVNVFEKDRQHVMRAMDRLVYEKEEIERNKNKASQIANQIVKDTKKINSKVPTSTTVIKPIQKEEVKEIEETEKMKILAATYLEAVKENKDLVGELQLLRAMAGTGLTISTFAHELKNMSALLVSRNDNLKEILKPLINEEQLKQLRKFQNPYIIIDDMKMQDEKLKSWLDISLETIKKDKRSRKKMDLFLVFNDLEALWRPVMQSQGTNIIVPKSLNRKCMFRLFAVDIDSIFNNLISNSTAAFKRRDALRKREIIIDLKQDKQNIIISYEDSGPGLPEGIKDPNIIFEPLFTTKLDKEGKEVGTGLGMWIVKSTIEEYNGKINILKSRPNFKVEIVLPLKKGEGIINNV